MNRPSFSARAIACAFGTLSIGASAAQGQCDFGFDLGTPYSTICCPQGICSADVNHDGRPDLIAVNDGPDMFIFLGAPSGFAPPIVYAVATWPACPTVADFNSDGHPDIVVSCGASSSVALFLGHGDGTFNPPVFIPGSPSGGGGATCVTAGDFDGDGDKDLAVTNQGSNQVTILKNLGGATFGQATAYPVGSTPYWVAAGDIDGDGDLDLAVSNHAGGSVTILRNNGGAFTSLGNTAVGSLPYACVFGDFNGNGTLDLAVADPGSKRVYTLLGSGTGTFQNVASLSLGEGAKRLAVADLDNDGKLDLAVPGNLHAFILEGNGDGTFVNTISIPTALDPSQASIADFDLDGDLDVAMSVWGANAVLIYSSSGEDCPCDADLNGDAVVGAADLSIMLGWWGQTGVPADLDHDGVVNAGDLGMLLGTWGACP